MKAERTAAVNTLRHGQGSTGRPGKVIVHAISFSRLFPDFPRVYLATSAPQVSNIQHIYELLMVASENDLFVRVAIPEGTQHDESITGFAVDF